MSFKKVSGTMPSIIIGTLIPFSLSSIASSNSDTANLVTPFSNKTCDTSKAP